LFSSFQKAKSAEFTLNSLQRGRPPAPAAADTPTMATELRTKLRVLSAELGQLVAERRALTTHRITRKIKARIRRQSREVEAGTTPRDYDEDHAAAPPTEAGLHLTDAEENHPLPDTVAD
jgi:hypothetical protein